MNLNKEDLVEKLQELPKKILGKQKQLMQTKNRISEIKLTLDNRELRYKTEIKNAKEDGKKKYKNKLERDTALNKYLKDDDEYQKLDRELKDKTEAVDKIKIRLSYLKRLNRNAIAISRLMSE